MNNYKIGKYIDPMTDYGFKKIFKNEQHKRLMRELLCNVFDPQIIEIEFVDSEHLGETEDDRRAYFDVECRTSEGKRFIVEVQLRDQEFFPERAVFYSTFLISEQAVKGLWDYNYNPVRFLGLMNFNMRGTDSKLSEDRFIHRYSLRDDDTHELLTDRLGYVFMEVARFNKEWRECATFEEKFLYYMKNLPNFAEEPEMLESGGYFDELLKAAEYESLTREEKRKYLKTVHMRGDYQNTIDFARKQGHEAGFAEGMEKGIEKGMEKGAIETKADIARNLTAIGMSVDQISKVTGLPESAIRAL